MRTTKLTSLLYVFLLRCREHVRLRLRFTFITSYSPTFSKWNSVQWPHDVLTTIMHSGGMFGTNLRNQSTYCQWTHFDSTFAGGPSKSALVNVVRNVCPRVKARAKFLNWSCVKCSDRNHLGTKSGIDIYQLATRANIIIILPHHLAYTRTPPEYYNTLFPGDTPISCLNQPKA